MTNVVNRPLPKKDSMELLKGTPLYTEDLVPRNALVVKVLRSPYANALIEEIHYEKALLLEDVEAVFTWKDCDQNGRRFSNAGQTYPQPSPYDRLLLDRHVRFVGDAVALVAAYTEKAAEKALKLIKVKYQVLEPVLDYHTAKDNPVLVHPEENWEAKLPSYRGDNKRNLVASGECGAGDAEAVLASSDVIIEHTYHTKAVNQTMMETFRASAAIDAYGRLSVVASTQIVFHSRRIIAEALGIPVSEERVLKPCIGGGFGAKQTAVCEFYP
ncbi:MAG: molybdopterin-dependent oxidoreductase, partial [Spirochaetales bacterium]|nr:molybdopterin-dependent oxidoreductase [Candidatus Physcosoma equi]